MTFIIPAKAAPTADPTKAQKNGNLSFKLTPNSAGSVIPIKAEIPYDEAKLFILSFLVNDQTAKVAAPCAMFAIEATTKIKSPAP